jgi:hypothetical protein
MADVRCPDARSRQYRRPDGVTFRFQVSLNTVEPSELNCVFNLLSKDDWRAALPDEAVEFLPEPSTRVRKAKSLPRSGEAGARAASCPTPEILVSCEFEGQAPASDSCKEMALVIPGYVSRCDITY